MLFVESIIILVYPIWSLSIWDVHIFGTQDTNDAQPILASFLS